MGADFITHGLPTAAAATLAPARRNASSRGERLEIKARDSVSILAPQEIALSSGQQQRRRRHAFIRLLKFVVYSAVSMSFSRLVTRGRRLGFVDV